MGQMAHSAHSPKTARQLDEAQKQIRALLAEKARLEAAGPSERRKRVQSAKKTAMAQASIENTVATQKLTAPKASVNGVVKTETQAEYDDRMEAIRLAAEAAEAPAPPRTDQRRQRRRAGR